MSRRDAVLTALRRAGEEGVSGEVLARELGVSRAAVAKHVAALRSAGYRVNAVTGSGYRLESAPDAPLPTEVAPLLSSARWLRLEGGGATRSTNDDAKALAREGAPDGTVVLASRQDSGRGRLGRSWSSPEGGVYLSVVLRPQLLPADASQLALVIGLGAAEGLERFGVRALLKWPNDLQLGGRKLAGVLLEMSAEADRVDWVVAGIGLNVRRTAEHELLTVSDTSITPAYLEDEAPDAGLAEVAAALLDGIAATLADFAAGGFADLRVRYELRDALAGHAVLVRDATGRAVARGTAAGVDDSGRLVLDSASGERTVVASGDVTLRDSEAF
jgi:BirA family biotin operon repressor/biotin-[acetyl-CoA-carboxylase] ligase